MPIRLTDEQKSAIKYILKKIKTDQVVKLGGYAGTGKSTIIRVLKQYLPRFSVCAYTGKAANVLRKKKVGETSTIHSLIYRGLPQKDGTIIWQLIDKYELDCEGFIIDEASMVSEEIYLDLLSFGKPIICIGDHGQLEPIGTSFNLMATPDVKLEQIHRNANEIAYFANHLRNGYTPQSFHAEKQVQIIDFNLIEDKHLANTDQVICAFNKTRVDINERVRRHLKINFAYIAKGEKIMCLRNNKFLKLFNGLQGIVTEVHKDDSFSFISDDKELYERISYNPNVFGQVAYDWTTDREEEYKNPFDYAYGITGHKSQGDEWGNVIVVAQRNDKWDSSKWNYTVASRAKYGLIWGKQN